MGPRRDPDANRGPRARQANRESRVDFSMFAALAYGVLAAGFVLVAVRVPRDVTNVVLAVAWVLLAGAWFWRYRRSSRLAGSHDPARPEGES